MTKLSLDLETNGFDYTRVWCVGVQDVKTKEYKCFIAPDVNHFGRLELKAMVDTADLIIMHSGCSFDWWVLKELLDIEIPMSKVFDTMVMSKLLNYRRFANRKGVPNNHKLSSWGLSFGYPKGDYNDWDAGVTNELLEYQKRDVELTTKVFWSLATELEKKGGMRTWTKAMELEQWIQWDLVNWRRDGFTFNKEKALETRALLVERTTPLAEGFQIDFPPQLQVVNRLKYKKLKSGELNSHCLKAYETYPECTITLEGELLCWDYIPFSPSSSVDRIDRLWEAGWNPHVKTKGHNTHDRDKEKDKYPEKTEKYARYGWQLCEENLETLPEDAPPAAWRLAEWLTLEGRRSAIDTWLSCYDESDGRIHGSMHGIGAWTERLAHTGPNTANIAAPFEGEADTSVKLVKKQFDATLRSLWCVPEGYTQIGTDAEGIQLRLLCHFTGSQQYKDALLEGDKTNGTDIHSLNQRALLLAHITRNMAKTFIYAWLLGAGINLVSRILQCNVAEARAAVESFTQSIEGLDGLKNDSIPKMWRDNKSFVGLDGRIVYPPSEHHMLAGMLQNGEAVVMKTAARIWRTEAKRIGLEHLAMTWPHDEWQTAAKERAEELGKLQRDAIVQAGVELNLFCPMSGETKLGANWLECH